MSEVDKVRILYSNILPLGTDEGQKTITETFNEYFQQADHVEIAVGYVSRASLEELDDMVDQNQTQKINLIIGMYYIEGMPEGSYHTAIKINNTIVCDSFLKNVLISHGIRK